jgi:citrate lyase subunit beta / citryl-CoA lyase
MRVPVRSFLFVPADSEKKLDKGRTSSADAIVIDLEDSVAAGRKREGRQMAAEYLASGSTRPGMELWVRVNPLRGAYILDDLAAVIRAQPKGLLLPKCEGPDDIRTLSNYLDVLEAREDIVGAGTEISTGFMA